MLLEPRSRVRPFGIACCFLRRSDCDDALLQTLPFWCHRQFLEHAHHRVKLALVELRLGDFEDLDSFLALLLLAANWKVAWLSFGLSLRHKTLQVAQVVLEGRVLQRFGDHFNSVEPRSFGEFISLTFSLFRHKKSRLFAGLLSRSHGCFDLAGLPEQPLGVLLLQVN